MKRLWIACGILAAIFAATLYNASYLNRFTASLSDRLTQAEAWAEAGNWAEAARLTEDAFQAWESHNLYLHVLLRHSDTDDINSSFQEVGEFISCQESGEYSAANARLITQIRLLYEAEQLSLKNIL
ncbi:DUF4363 family protein [uncultured Pseudoflavonifractor sp.]|uniref:DUF4363 family protein n=1 Tax=uncultured Pseudoflavonifractor sp. TaxID=1221379 RepID=UPI0025F174C5|nr:DUF4363 family protein [uncultured Pseudoflavonifractor sp.]